MQSTVMTFFLHQKFFLVTLLGVSAINFLFGRITKLESPWNVFIQLFIFFINNTGEVYS